MDTKSNPDYTQYVKSALEGNEHKRKHFRLLCGRVLSDHKRQEDDSFPWKFHEDEVNKRVRVFEIIVGKPTPFQRFLIGERWGWRSKDNPARLRYRESIIEDARISGISTLMAEEAIHNLLRKDGVQGTHTLSFSTNRAQEEACFLYAKGLIDNNAELSSVLHTTKTKITNKENGSSFIPQAAPPSSQGGYLSGYVTSLLIIENINEIRNQSAISDLLADVWKLEEAHTTMIATSPESKNSIYREYRQSVIEDLENNRDSNIFGVFSPIFDLKFD